MFSHKGLDNDVYLKDVLVFHTYNFDHYRLPFAEERVDIGQSSLLLGTFKCNFPPPPHSNESGYKKEVFPRPLSYIFITLDFVCNNPPIN